MLAIISLERSPYSLARFIFTCEVHIHWRGPYLQGPFTGGAHSLARPIHRRAFTGGVHSLARSILTGVEAHINWRGPYSLARAIFTGKHIPAGSIHWRGPFTGVHSLAGSIRWRDPCIGKAHSLARPMFTGEARGPFASKSIPCL